jgi:hypothetical protein
MRLVSWKPVHRASLRGFATVELPIGLRFVHCPVFVGSNGPWVALPSKPVLDYEGKHAKPDDRPQFSACSVASRRTLWSPTRLTALITTRLGAIRPARKLIEAHGADTVKRVLNSIEAANLG